MKKKCLSCGAQFSLSGSGKRQKYCPGCSKQGIGKVWGLSASKSLKTKGAGSDFSSSIPRRRKHNLTVLDIPPAGGTFKMNEGNKFRVWPSATSGGRVWVGHLEERWHRKLCGFSEPRDATAKIIRVEGNSHIPLTRLEPEPRVSDPACVQENIWPRPWGYKVRLYIEAEKELQELGCGWRIVIVELDGSRVFLHHNGSIARMKRDAFKALLARNKRSRRSPIKLVVSNLPKGEERFRDAA